MLVGLPVRASIVNYYEQVQNVEKNDLVSLMININSYGAKSYSSQNKYEEERGLVPVVCFDTLIKLSKSLLNLLVML
jgi:hypothetical protein